MPEGVPQNTRCKVCNLRKSVNLATLQGRWVHKYKQLYAITSGKIATIINPTAVFRINLKTPLYRMSESLWQADNVVVPNHSNDMATVVRSVSIEVKAVPRRKNHKKCRMQIVADCREETAPNLPAVPGCRQQSIN